MVLFCNWLNVVLYAIFILEISVHEKRVLSAASDFVGQPETRSLERRRVKRVFNGTETANDEYPYVVFLKSSLRTSDAEAECVKKLCTGTLIHRRFVITANTCVNSSAAASNSSKPNDIKIFLETRPYDEMTNNTIYNVGQKVDVDPLSEAVSYKIALVLMNDTFRQVKYFPKIFDLNPVAENSPMSCTTVGFSLLGRNLPAPIVGRVRPAWYKFSAQFSVSNCVPKNPTTDRGAYMCNVASSSEEPLRKLLCERGDEGSPLLCKPHANETSNGDETSTASSNNENSGARDDGLYLYGIADVVADAANCGPRGFGFPVLFLYTLEYGAWVNKQLAEFDESENEPAGIEEFETNATKRTTAAASTVLPEYYDTDDYDRTVKKPIRCGGRNVVSS